MKKLFTAMAAIALCSTAAFAQGVVKDVTFQAQGYDADETMLESVNSNIVVTFVNYNPTSEYKPHLMVATGGGFEIGQEPVELDPTPIIGTANYACVFSMDKSTWGNPYLGNFQATLMVYFENEDGDYLFDDDDEPLMFMQSYVSPNVDTAVLVSVYPDGNWIKETFEKAYNRGEITFSFNNEVTFTNLNNIGTIKYVVDDFEDEVDITSYTSEWNLMDGNWAVSFNFKNEDYAAADLTKIVIELSGVKTVANQQLVSVPSVILSNPAAPQPAPRIKKAMENELTSNNELVNIYNLQGALIKESVQKAAIKELPAGIYIVGGKKVVCANIHQLGRD